MCGGYIHQAGAAGYSRSSATGTAEHVRRVQPARNGEYRRADAARVQPGKYSGNNRVKLSMLSARRTPIGEGEGHQMYLDRKEMRQGLL